MTELEVSLGQLFMDEIIAADLSHLSVEMKIAATNFVDLKLRIDTEGRIRPKNIPSDLHGPMRGGEYGPYDGFSFFNKIVPFLPDEYAPQNASVMLVPVSHTLGCSWNWWPDYEKPMRERDKITSIIMSDAGVKSTAYTYVPELGIFLPGEGKNRINFCRYNNIEYVPAMVYVKNYPASDRIKIYAVNTVAGREVWAILDDKFAQKLVHYDYVLPLMRAYGVTVAYEWPQNLPSISEIYRYIIHLTDRHHTPSEIISIDEVRKLVEVSKSRERYVKCCLIDLPVRNRVSLILFPFFMFLAYVVIFYGFSDEDNAFPLIFISFILGVTGMMLSPILYISKKYLDGE